MLIDLAMYEAYMDEVHRFNMAIHRRRIRPTVYRDGKTYLVYYVEIESDVLWFLCYELVWDWQHQHGRIPYVTDDVIYCVSGQEWEHLLRESGVDRNPYFAGAKIVTGKLVSLPLTL